MDRRVVVEAPAKVNLHLQVLGKRPDGFHDILSLFQAVSLSDTLDLRIGGEGGIRIRGEFDCPDAENTLVRAARAFQDAAGVRDGLFIRAVKRIPAGAGLGGGSSDAAAVLKALNLAYGDRFSTEELSELGAAVGSDVPFFFGSPCAIVSGRGERVDAEVSGTGYGLVVVFPGFPTSTAEAYVAVDRARPDGPAAVGADADWIRSEYRKDPASWTFRNDFYDAQAPGKSELRRACEALRASGALFAGMTGSGSALFGVYGTESAAERAAEILDGREGDQGLWSAVSAAPLARMPVPRLE